MLSNYFEDQNGVPEEFLPAFESLEIAQRALVQSFVVGWFVFLGACFASFLNVVAWRLPRGRGIVGSSHCPFCNTKLPMTANTPIIGWLRSGGRCLTCRLPISVRYLIVEIVLGLIFLAVVWVELFCGGVNLPLRPANERWGIARAIVSPKYDLLQILSFHLHLICIIFAMALVRLENMRIPISIFVYGLITCFGLQLLWPWTQQASWPHSIWPMLVRYPAFWVTVAMGLGGGYVCGEFIALSQRGRNAGYYESRRECIWSFMLIGLGLGFQFALSLALAVLIIDSLLGVIGDVHSPMFQLRPIFKIGTLLVALLMGWKITAEFGFWPGPNSNESTLVIAMGFIAILALALSLMNNQAHESPIETSV